MTRKLLQCLLLLITIKSWASDKKPKDTNSNNLLSQVNFFKKVSTKGTLHFAHAFAANETLSNSNRLTLSYRHRIRNSLSTGLVTMLASGARHNEDWIKDSTPWHWRETKDRYEFNYGLYLQYKKLLNKKGNLLLKARLHYQINSFNNQQEFIFRTGVLSLLTSKISWLTQVDFHIPTNYQRSFLREFWIYSGLGRQMTKNIFLGLQLSYGVEIWNESKNFFDKTQSEFRNSNKSFTLGPILNFYY